MNQRFSIQLNNFYQIFHHFWSTQDQFCSREFFRAEKVLLVRKSIPVLISLLEPVVVAGRGFSSTKEHEPGTSPTEENGCIPIDRTKNCKLLQRKIVSQSFHPGKQKPNLNRFLKLFNIFLVLHYYYNSYHVDDCTSLHP